MTTERLTLSFRSDSKTTMAEDMLRLAGRLGLLPGVSVCTDSDKPRKITLKRRKG